MTAVASLRYVTERLRNVTIPLTTARRLNYADSIAKVTRQAVWMIARCDVAIKTLEALPPSIEKSDALLAVQELKDYLGATT